MRKPFLFSAIFAVTLFVIYLDSSMAQPIGTPNHIYRPHWDGLGLEKALPNPLKKPIHPMFSPGKIPRSSKIFAWAYRKGFRVTRIGMGGKMVILESKSSKNDIETDGHRIQTILLKAGSKSRGSNSPHVQFVPRHPKNVPGERPQIFLDPFDQLVPNRSPGNHTLMIWDFTGRYQGDLITHLPHKPYFKTKADRENERENLAFSKLLMCRARGLNPDQVSHYRVRETSDNPAYASFVQVLEPKNKSDRRGKGFARFRHFPLPRVGQKFFNLEP